MKKICLIIGCLILVKTIFGQGRIGINTTTPAAILHVKDSNVVFSAANDIPGAIGNPPITGAGIRMMWYPDKAAFRVGHVYGNNWDKDSIGNYSFASGNETKATGYASVAMGGYSNAMANNALAMGSGAIASGLGSIAIGTGVTAQADQSTAMGIVSKASGYRSVAIGSFATAFGDFSVALGNGTSVGNSAVAIGLQTTAIGLASTAMGQSTRSPAANSTSMGLGTVSRSFGSLVIGRYNDSIASSNTVLWINTDPAFIVGNGASDISRSNAFVVYKNGNVTAAGNLSLTTGEVTRTTTGAADLVPICYGSVSSIGGINSGTSNFTVTNSVVGEYEIAIAGETYTNSAFTTTVTVVNSSSPKLATTTVVSGHLLVKIWDLNSNEVSGGFHFTVYKP